MKDLNIYNYKEKRESAQMKNETKSIIIANTTQNIKKEKRIEKFLKENKFFSIILITFFCFAIINFYLIFTFMRILQNSSVIMI